MHREKWGSSLHSTLFSCWAWRKRSGQQCSVRIAVSSSNCVGRSDAFEPLQQSHGLRVIGKTVQRNGEIVGAKVFRDVSNFQIVLASSWRGVWDLIRRSDVVAERIVHSFNNFVTQRIHISKSAGVVENSRG